MRTVMGIDLSLTGTGVAVIQGKTILYTNTVDTKGMKGFDRIDYILNLVQKIHEQFSPDLVILEGYAFGARGRAVFDLGELGGVVRHWLWTNRIHYYDVAPTSLKKFVTGNGHATKEEVMESILHHFGRNYSDDNQADAIGLAMYGRYIILKERDSK